jgi:hypothetical protein
MVQSPSWQANSQPVKKFPTFYGTQKFITVYTKLATDRCLEPD